MQIHFTIPGPPKGKARPRVTKSGHAYTPQDTAVYENLVRLEYQRQCGQTRFGDEEGIEMELDAYFPIPKSAGKKAKLRMERGVLRPTKKADGDNILKLVADSLNQLAYRDDAQIVSATVNKQYADIPRVEVTLSTYSTPTTTAILIQPSTATIKPTSKLPFICRNRMKKKPFTVAISSFRQKETCSLCTMILLKTKKLSTKKFQQKRNTIRPQSQYRKLSAA